MKTLYLLVGIPGSGKTTYRSKKFSDPKYLIICPDEIIGYTEESPWTPERAREAWKDADNLLKESLKNEDARVVFDATFVSIKKRKKYADVGRDADARVVAIFIDTPTDICRQRNESRDIYRRVPLQAFGMLSKKLMAPTLEEGFDSVAIIDGITGRVTNVYNKPTEE